MATNIFDKLRAGASTASAAETQALAAELAVALPPDTTLALHGDLGVAPGSAITGTDGITFASGGKVHQNDAVATQAQLDANAAYDRLQALLGGVDLSGQDLGSLRTLGSGIYRFSTSAALTGAMTIDFANDPAGVIVFQIGSTLTTASNSVVNVIFDVGSTQVRAEVTGIGASPAR